MRAGGEWLNCELLFNLFYCSEINNDNKCYFGNPSHCELLFYSSEINYVILVILVNDII